jgi:hypothetical protein
VSCHVVAWLVCCCVCQLLLDPASLYFDVARRRCDLRAGVSYNRGRCILYLLALWIKGQTGARQTYEFVLPRSSLQQRGSTSSPIWSVSDLEHIMLHSYSAEYIVAQYFPHAFSVKVVEPNSVTSAPLATSIDAGPQTRDEYDTADTDAFSKPIREQPYVIFTVQWP